MEQKRASRYTAYMGRFTFGVSCRDHPALAYLALLRSYGCEHLPNRCLHCTTKTDFGLKCLFGHKIDLRLSYASYNVWHVPVVTQRRGGELILAAAKRVPDCSHTRHNRGWDASGLHHQLVTRRRYTGPTATFSRLGASRSEQG